VTSEDEARDLVGGVFGKEGVDWDDDGEIDSWDVPAAGSLNELLNNAKYKAYEAAFKAAYSTTKDPSDFKDDEAKTKNSVKYNVKIKDAVTLKKILTDAGLTVPGTATIDGTINESASTNFSSLEKENETYGDDLKKGDSRSGSVAQKLTYVIKDFTDYVTGYKVGGYITVDTKWSGKYTITDPSIPSKADYKENNDNKYVQKVSVALTISDGTKAAKIRYSSAFQRNGQRRKIVDNDKNAIANLEVYNNDNVLLFTIQNYQNWDIIAFDY